MGRYELPRLPLVYLPVGAVALWLSGRSRCTGRTGALRRAAGGGDGACRFGAGIWDLGSGIWIGKPGWRLSELSGTRCLRRAIDLAEAVYLASAISQAKSVCLTAQFRRACRSVPSNMQKARSFQHARLSSISRIALGSLAELETQL